MSSKASSAHNSSGDLIGQDIKHQLVFCRYLLADPQREEITLLS